MWKSEAASLLKKMNLGHLWTWWTESPCQYVCESLPHHDCGINVSVVATLLMSGRVPHFAGGCSYISYIAPLWFIRLHRGERSPREERGH